MSDLTAHQIAVYAYRAGFRGQGLTDAVAISLAESSGNPHAVGDVGLETSQWGPSVGLWQIRSLWDQTGTGDQRDRDANLNPLTNARHAFQISDGGKDFEPWSTYTGDEYQAHLGAAAAAAKAVTADPPGRADKGHGHHGHSHSGSGTTTIGGDPGGHEHGGKDRKVSVSHTEMHELGGLLDEGHSEVTRRQPLAQDVATELQAASTLPVVGSEASALLPLADELGSLLGQLAAGLASDKELVSKTDKAVHHVDRGGVPDPIARLLPPGVVSRLDGKGGPDDHHRHDRDHQHHDHDHQHHATTTASTTLRAEEHKVIDAAKSFLGVPYVYGGDSHAGVDCSGLTSLAYLKAFGRNIGRDTSAQLQSGRTVGKDGDFALDRKLLQPGDLIFYGEPGASGPNAHVVMYIGDGKVIQAPCTGEDVQIVPLYPSASSDEPFLGVRRYLPAPAQQA